MKLLRFLLIGAALVVVLVVIVLALAFTPGVQTWAARRAVASQPDLNVGIGRVAVGLNSSRVENIRFEQPGVILTLPAAEVDLALLDAAGGKVTVKRLVAKGWTLDLTTPAASAVVSGPSAAAAKPAAPAVTPAKPAPVQAAQAAQTVFNGIFQLLQLPVELGVDVIDLEGDVVLPEGSVHVVLNGGQLGAGREAKFVLDAGFKPAAGANLPVSALALHSAVTATMDTPKSFTQLGLAATATATGPQFPGGARLDVTLAASHEGQGEDYDVILRSGEKELVRLDIKLPAGAAPLTGTWTLNLRDADVAPFTLGQTLPTFTAAGQGTFTSNRAFDDLHAAGKFEATAGKLATVAPELAAVGDLRVTADFDVASQGELIRVTRLDARVAGASPVASVEVLQGIEFNSRTSELKVADPAASLLRLKLQGLPLAWAQPFLGDLKLTGRDVTGEFVASASQGGFSLRPVVPITLAGLSVSQAGRPLVQALDVTLSASADYAPQGWQAEVAELAVRSAGATLLKLNAKAGQVAGTATPIKATGAYEASLPALLAQPVAAGAAALSQGTARGDFTASVAENQQVSLTLQLAGLVAADRTPLPEVAVHVRADLTAAGRIDAQIPVVITRAGRRSDLTLGAVVNQLKDGTQIAAQLTSDALYVEDLLVLSSLAPAPVEAAPAATPKPAPAATPATKPVTAAPATPAPAAPLWAGVTGELKLALKKIVYTSEVQITDVAGTVKIAPDALTLDNLRAVLGQESRLKAGGGLTFDPKVAEPYELKADVSITDFDPAPALRAFSSGQPAPVEGKFDLTTHLAGRAKDPAGFSDTALGEVKLASRGGTFRALGVKATAAASNTSKAAELVGFLGSLAGSSSTVKYADRARAAADVAQTLAAIPFDQLNVVLARDAQNDIAIKDLTLISPLVRLVGTGQITYQAEKPLVQQPLKMTLQLGAREQLATNLRTLKLLGDKADSLGYIPLVEQLQLEGSLQSISSSQLQSLINRAIAD